MAMPSLSYEPATDLLIYPGTANIKNHINIYFLYPLIEIVFTNCNKGGGKQTSALTPQFLSEEIGGDRGQAWEERRQEHANLSYMNSNMQWIQHIMYEAWGKHQPGINSSSNNASC